MSVLCLSTDSKSKTKLVCPFDLDTIFSLQYSVQGLRSVLEFIIDNLGTVDEKAIKYGFSVI